MPKKKFEQAGEGIYDPFAAEEKRSAIRAAVGHEPEPTEVMEREVTLAPAAAPVAAVIAKPPEEIAEEPLARPVPQLQKTGSRGGIELARSSQRQSVQKRFRITESEEQEFEAFVLRIRTAASSKVDFSVISRTMWTLVQHAESEILEMIRKTDVPKRPGKHDTLGLAEYEEHWVRILSAAMRRASPVK